MKTRFVVPAAVAMALHAVLLFGFRTHPGADPRIAARPADKPALDPIVIEWISPPERADGEEAASSGVAIDARNDLPEPPKRDTILSIPIPDRDPATFAPDSSSSFLGPPGVPNGPAWLEGRTNGPVTPGQLDHSPRATSQIAPNYPYEARVKGRAADVLVEFLVDESGRVVDPHVLRSSDPAFEAPTLRAVAKWRFEPGRRHGQIVRFKMAVPVGFAVTP